MITKASVGIDISKDSFDVRFGVLEHNQQQRFPAQATFPNNRTGFRKLLTWTAKQLPAKKKIPVWFVLEATGVYHEHLAYYLHEHGKAVAVVLPNKIKHYTKTLEAKSKTDRLDARAISQFGLERPQVAWQPPSPQLRRLKELTREQDSLQEQATLVKNQLHAKRHSHAPGEGTLDRLQAQLRFLAGQVAQIEREIQAVLDEDPELKRRISLIATTKGLGLATVLRVVAETAGFALIRNAKQLTSYAGMDPVVWESGLKRGRCSISKRGNRHLRRAVFMPALVALRYNKQLKGVFLRLVASRGSKMIAVIAVARKLLCLIYALWCSGKEWDPNYTQPAHTT